MYYLDTISPQNYRSKIKNCPVCDHEINWNKDKINQASFSCKCGLGGYITPSGNLKFRYYCVSCDDEKRVYTPPIIYKENWYCPTCARKLRTPKIEITTTGHVRIRLSPLFLPDMIVLHCGWKNDLEREERGYILKKKTPPIISRSINYNERNSVCTILKTHKDILQNDPERLSTNFMKNLIRPNKSICKKIIE